MATEHEIIKISEKIAREARNNKTLKLIEIIRIECKPFSEIERNKIVKFLTQIRLVLNLLKRSFPNGRINEDFAAKMLGIDKKLFVFKIAIKIVNEEEKDKPLSNYIHFEESTYNYTKIDYSKYY